MSAQQIIKAWAAQLGWTWPDGYRTPSGVFAAVADRLGVSAGYVRLVYGGSHRFPAAWLERWPINNEEQG